jgi:hypothetical protein
MDEGSFRGRPSSFALRVIVSGDLRILIAIDLTVSGRAHSSRSFPSSSGDHLRLMGWRDIALWNAARLNLGPDSLLWVLTILDNISRVSAALRAETARESVRFGFGL